MSQIWKRAKRLIKISSSVANHYIQKSIPNFSGCFFIIYFDAVYQHCAFYYWRA